MLLTATNWKLDVERGPEWIYVKVSPPRHPIDAQDASGLAESIWEVLQSHFCYRIVLELEDVDLLFSAFLGQLISLSKRVHSHQGMLRICGLSDVNQEVLHTCKLEAALPNYECRSDAVMGHRPTQPR
jgi:anti-anti-sigma factor